MASRRKRRNKVNAKGRNENPVTRFVGLPHEILMSPAYRSLDTVARSLLTELVMLDHGRNNGSLWLSVRDAIDRLGMSDPHAIIRGFDMLQEAGLIAMTKDAHFSVKAAETSRARCWRITWRPFDGKPATNEWRDYQPPAGSKENRRAIKGLQAIARYRKQLSSNKIPVMEFTSTGEIKPKKGR